MLGAEGPSRLVCSRSGCSEMATRKVVWRNPKIHVPEREKVWLSCGEHAQFFLDYLGAREFPVRLEALEESL